MNEAFDRDKQFSFDAVRLQALMHLVKHVGHFPMSSGAAQMNSIVTEVSDQFDDVTEDAGRWNQLLTADNVQVDAPNIIAILTTVTALIIVVIIIRTRSISSTSGDKRKGAFLFCREFRCDINFCSATTIS